MFSSYSFSHFAIVFAISIIILSLSASSSSSRSLVHAFLWFPTGARDPPSDIADCTPARCGNNLTTVGGDINWTSIQSDYGLNFTFGENNTNSSVSGVTTYSPSAFVSVNGLRVSLPDYYDFHTCYYDTYKYGPRWAQCRCFMRMVKCLEDEMFGNCTTRMARQACFDFWSDIDVGCSFRLCLSAGKWGGGVLVLIVMMIIVVMFM